MTGISPWAETACRTYLVARSAATLSADPGSASSAADSGVAPSITGTGTALAVAGSGTVRDEGREALLLFFLLGCSAEVIAGLVASWRSSAGTITGAGRAVSGSVDSVEEDSEGESHEICLPRLPTEISGCV